jgi:hypothetical protein
MSELSKLTKEQLVARVEELEANNAALKASKKIGRKEQVAELLQNGTKWHHDKLAKHIEGLDGRKFTTRNLSSQLSYLRNDHGWELGKDGRGRITVEKVGDFKLV